MTDVVSKQTRSKMMSGIKNKNTQPELILRKTLHRLGYRFKLHDKSLPGKPDLVLPKFKAVIQVHGCFWHKHDCHIFKWPKSRTSFWREKILRNAERDKEQKAALEQAGWRVLVVWECCFKGKTRLPEQQTLDFVVDWLENCHKSAELAG